MRKILFCAAIAVFGAPAFAQTTDTLKEVTTKGITIDIGGMLIDVDYKPDGTFTAAEGQVTGKWSIKDDKLCTTSNMSPDEECVAYPAGKKSGDSFELTGAAGTATVKIR